MQYKKCFYIKCDQDCSVLKISMQNRINKKKKNRKTALLSAKCDESNKSNQEFTRANISWMLRWRKDLARSEPLNFQFICEMITIANDFFRHIIVTVITVHTHVRMCITTPTRTRPRITHTYTSYTASYVIYTRAAHTHARAHAHIHIYHSRSVATTRGSRECTRRSLSPISQEKSDERIRRRSPRRSRVTTTRCASAPFHHGWAALAFKSRRSHHDETTVADCRIR